MTRPIINAIIPFPASALALVLALLTGCSGRGESYSELSGRGFVHYHPYPAVGQCSCSSEYDFAAHGMMVAAANESIHKALGNDLCANRRYALVSSRSTGRQVRVMIVDQGGQPTDDFNRLEQHSMDLSIEAFDALDPDGKGKHAGRIYVDWTIIPTK